LETRFLVLLILHNNIGFPVLLTHTKNWKPCRPHFFHVVEGASLCRVYLSPDDKDDDGEEEEEQAENGAADGQVQALGTAFVCW
jgi:hypothetical protein